MLNKTNSLDMSPRPSPVVASTPRAAVSVASAAATDASDPGAARQDSREALLRQLSRTTLELMDRLRQADAQQTARLLRANPQAAAELATVFALHGGVHWLASFKQAKQGKQPTQTGEYAAPQPTPPAGRTSVTGELVLTQSGARHVHGDSHKTLPDETTPATLQEQTPPPGVLRGVSGHVDVGSNVQGTALQAFEPLPLMRKKRRNAFSVLQEEETEASGTPFGVQAHRRVRGRLRR